ncbi:ankyrin repeat and SOCS box protein 16 [Astyanax mexicanus]|uniref:Ankyrin repeat and SOCS box containing 16 n=1 Tax=Astyanax mexicanus TaxID=7994 RepID=A0A8B9JGL9_ASTMX|nr:ankyrin repeat and SOCS box protein 16 [Astyanax mexicanus]XP_022520730.2 ankyrin repeat and SOCS box protein 16 [Astyanax mexicanus]XP_022520731.2 ankyrin repeat and SOCS box protein 16 [Astyanax mexicanus]KAG9264470.1 ankyrin repeat and SOCS box protein 16 [Astyanax mexicanus]
MSRDTFAFTSASLRSLRLEQELQDWEDARRALAHRRAMTRRPLPAAPRLRHGTERIQTVRAPPPQIHCRDPTIHNTFMWGDMKGVYAVLKEPGMVNALMEIVHEEMVWTPEMGMWTLSSKVKQTSALRLAAGRGRSDCVEELLFRGADVDADPGGRTALHDACSGGHNTCVKLLLDHGADPDLPTADGSTPLHLCNTADTYLCAELLVSNGANVNVTQRDSCLTPLHVACRRGLEEHVELLLVHRADVTAQSCEGETPLNAACAGAERPSEAGQYLRVVQRLLDAGADACTAGRKQHSALHNSCANCNYRITDLLLQHGARAHAVNCAGYTPMDCLLQVVEDYPDQYPELIARSLLNHGAKPPSSRMLKECVLSPNTLEVILNCFQVVPACEEWLQDVPDELLKEHRPFFDSVWRMIGQPRKLQHLCRCSLRRHLGAQCHSTITKLNIPCALREYLLLRIDGEIH